MVLIGFSWIFWKDFRVFECSLAHSRANKSAESNFKPWDQFFLGPSTMSLI